MEIKLHFNIKTNSVDVDMVCFYNTWWLNNERKGETIRQNDEWAALFFGKTTYSKTYKMFP